MVIRDFEIPMPWGPPIKGKEIETIFGILRVIPYEEIYNEHQEAAIDKEVHIRSDAEGKVGSIQEEDGIR
jgi:hypothetical protein